jgi:hypothetical protein
MTSICHAVQERKIPFAGRGDRSRGADTGNEGGTISRLCASGDALRFADDSRPSCTSPRPSFAPFRMRPECRQIYPTVDARMVSLQGW